MHPYLVWFGIFPFFFGVVCVRVCGFGDIHTQLTGIQIDSTMTDNVENKDSMITAYTRISPDSSDLRFIKIVKFQHHVDKTLTSIPFPSPLPNNTSASNHINLKHLMIKQYNWERKLCNDCIM